MEHRHIVVEGPLEHMTGDGGRRIAISNGAMLADPASIGNCSNAEVERWFEPNFWQARGELAPVTGGRGAAWFIGSGSDAWVLRHYRRGGAVARLTGDVYVWAGENRVRAFSEWRLLAHLAKQGLPVPDPIAACYRRAGLLYRCDLITRRILDAHPLSARLARAGLEAGTWRDVGTIVARLHAAGADHADLNAHNILLDANNQVSVIDFDRGKLRVPGRWTSANLARLERSLRKVGRVLPAGRFTPADWRQVLEGYASP
ncbi:MAG: 3-deoxy-D-manno-octulosonic acid kinase [Pseudomonadota bacterium]|nr:3-deoxy-D-manno-octulosonic acid kinase [Pseudomonadota bacterium]